MIGSDRGPPPQGPLPSFPCLFQPSVKAHARAPAQPLVRPRRHGIIMNSALMHEQANPITATIS